MKHFGLGWFSKPKFSPGDMVVFNHPYLPNKSKRETCVVIRCIQPAQGLRPYQIMNVLGHERTAWENELTLIEIDKTS